MDVREVMTPRVDVTFLTIPVQADDIARAVRTSGHSCFPVVHDDLDDLIGILFVNDIFRTGKDGPLARDATDPSPLEISRKVRQPYLAPRVAGRARGPGRHAQAPARRRRRGGRVRRRGRDPDRQGPPRAPGGRSARRVRRGGRAAIVRVDGTRWLIDGQTNVDVVRERLGIDLPDGEYVTLGGLLFERFGHIPAEGEQVRVGDWDLRVVEMDKRRVAQVVATSGSPRPRCHDARRPDPIGRLRWLACFLRGADGLWRSLVSALRSGRRGPRFKSGQPDHESPWSEV
jgi:hypothetical protein